jgi:hypothetical protein
MHSEKSVLLMIQRLYPATGLLLLLLLMMAPAMSFAITILIMLKEHGKWDLVEMP